MSDSLSWHGKPAHAPLLVTKDAYLKSAPNLTAFPISMFFQLILLALLPFAAMATPILERSDKGKLLFCFHKGQDQMYSINDHMTKSVCNTLSSGSLLEVDDNYSFQGCKVADYDVTWFKERCESHNPKSEATEWKAGSELDVVWEPKEPYDLACFSRTKKVSGSVIKSSTSFDGDATMDVCASVKSGKYHEGKTKKSCRVAKEDLSWFKKKCGTYGDDDDDDDDLYIAGTAMKPVI